MITIITDLLKCLLLTVLFISVGAIFTFLIFFALFIFSHPIHLSNIEWLKQNALSYASLQIDDIGVGVYRVMAAVPLLLLGLTLGAIDGLTQAKLAQHRYRAAPRVSSRKLSSLFLFITSLSLAACVLFWSAIPVKLFLLVLTLVVSFLYQRRVATCQ